MAQLITSFYKGRRVVIPITYKVDSVAVDVTGYTFTFMMKKRLSFDDADAILTKDAALSDPTNGIVTLTLTEEETDIKPMEYYYDLMLTDDSGYVTQLDQNKVEVLTPVNLP